MSLVESLRKAIQPLPPNASLTLSVEWIRAGLEIEGIAASPAQPSEPEADLTVEQVAEIMGKKPGTVRGWIRNGLNGIRLAAYHFTAKEYRITRAAVDDFLDAQRRRTMEPKPLARQPGSDDLGRWRTARAKPRRA